MRARSFCYVCLGVLALALAYHLGASTATAQTSGAFLVGSFDVDTDIVAVDGTGQVSALGWHNGRGLHAGPIALPKAGTVVSVAGDVPSIDAVRLCVLYADGDAYEYRESSWTYCGNLGGVPTPAQRESMGSVKARYR